jgi:predicted amidohydrolase
LDAAQPIPGPHSDRLAQAAREHGIYVAAGLVEAAGPHRYNAAVLWSPQGNILLHHRKINELDFALDLYEVGDRLAVVDCELGRVGLTICADNLPGSLELAGSLCRMGAQLLLSPSAWAVDADHDEKAHPYGSEWLESYGELAYLYNVTLVGVSNVGAITAGAWAGKVCIGRSLCVGPTGVLARAPYGVSAQSTTVIEIEPQVPPARGTALSDLVASRRQSKTGGPT